MCGKYFKLSILFWLSEWSHFLSLQTTSHILTVVSAQDKATSKIIECCYVNVFQLTVNGMNIVKEDMYTFGGVINEIDGLFLPKFNNCDNTMIEDTMVSTKETNITKVCLLLSRLSDFALRGYTFKSLLFFGRRGFLVLVLTIFNEGLIWHLSQSSIRPSIYFSLIVKSRSNLFLEPTSTKQ